MPLVPFEIPPGVVKSDSPNAAKGRYTDTDKVHFSGRFPEKWKGWQKWLADDDILLGRARGAESWANADGNQNATFGTHLKLYAVTGEDRLRDITPIRATGTLGTDAFDVTNGDVTVTVNHTAHGADDGAFVTLSDVDTAFVIDRTLGTNIGDLTGDGGLAAAFDGTTDQAVAASATKATATDAYIGKTLATAAPIAEAIVYGSNDAGYVSGANPEVTIALYGKNGAAPANGTDGTLLGTLAAFTDTADESGNPRTVTSTDTATEYDHVWVYVTHDGSAATMSIAEVQFYAYVLIDGEYQLTKIDSGSYSIEIAEAPKTTASGGGSSADYSYQINPGSETTVFGFGWGAGRWNEGTWGTPRDSATGVVIELRYWSLEEYGNELLATPTFGTLYLWEESTDTNAEAVSNAPSSARFMFVTGERFVFMLGTDTPMTVEWADQDDITDWTPSASNTANIRTLQAGSKLMGGIAFADLLNLVWTDTTLYLFQYTGSTFVYEPRIVGKNCGLAAPGAFCIASGVAFWMSGNDFKMYAGSVQSVPNAEDISAYVFDDVNPTHIFKTWCQYNEIANAVIWGYVSLSSPDDEPDKYVEVSLDGTFAWSVGTLDRTASTTFRPADGSLLMAGPDDDGNSIIYQHEVGNDADGSALNAHITFGLYSLGGGQQNVDIMGFVPDFQRQVKAVSLEISTKDRPNDTDNFDEATETISVGEGIADLRVSGRHFTWTLRSNVLGGDFRGGIPMLELQAAGERR